MSSDAAPLPAVDLRALRQRVLAWYDLVTVLMLIGIAVLVSYMVRLGTLVGPGVEESFGLALSLTFLMAAVLFHIVDRTYRSWPLGRRTVPPVPGVFTEKTWLTVLKWLTVAAAAGALAYILSGLFT